MWKHTLDVRDARISNAGILGLEKGRASGWWWWMHDRTDTSVENEARWTTLTRGRVIQWEMDQLFLSEKPEPCTCNTNKKSVGDIVFFL